MKDNPDARHVLGLTVIRLSFLTLAIIGVALLVFALIEHYQGNRSAAVVETVKLLLASVLPLLGAWVGAVIAYYFGKENFEAANRSTQELVRSVSQRLISVLVKEEMLPRGRMVTLEVPEGKTLDDVSFKDVDDKFRSTGDTGLPITRLPVLDASGAFLAIIHRGVWLEMTAASTAARSSTLGAGDPDATGATPGSPLLKTILDQDYPLRPGVKFRQFITTTVAFVGIDKSMAEAKAALEGVSGCQDVIVTEHGKRTERVLGWVTNVEIARASHA